ncbi:MAG TPA: hypothetical protein VFC82_04180 [Actinomycetaceae bacterium]|nr:hypothetical protein [Actinomycetaceae bacterium]
MRTLPGIALALSLALVAGCSVRLDVPDPTPPPATPAEEVRQREALRAREYASTADFGAGVPAVERVAAHAGRHLEALGGVWEPWPEGDGPTEPAYPSPSADVGPFTDVAGLAASFATTTPEVCDEALIAEDDAAATLYASMCVSRMLDWDMLAATTGQPSPEFPAPSTDLVTPDAHLIVTLDAAAWATEVHAATARAAGDAGWVDLEARADRFRTLAFDAVTAYGWAGTAEDPRLPSYDTDALPDQATVAAEITRASVGAMAAAPDRVGMLDLALATAIDAQRGGVDLGPLPGID